MNNTDRKHSERFVQPDNLGSILPFDRVQARLDHALLHGHGLVAIFAAAVAGIFLHQRVHVRAKDPVSA